MTRKQKTNRSRNKFGMTQSGDDNGCNVIKDNGMTPTQSRHPELVLGSIPVEVHNCRKAAFTLAEVLITLGIVGVVAAMTLPTLVNKIEQQVLIQQFKKMYANLSNALQATVFQDNDGNTYPCWGSGGGPHEYNCTQFYNDFTKHLKLIKSQTIKHLPYKDENQVKAEGGILNRINLADDYQDDSYCTSTFQNCNGGYYKYYLADGSIFYRPKTYGTIPPYTIILDVNGDKKPNRWGYDVYILNINKKTNGVMYITTNFKSYLIEKGGMSAADIIKK